MHPDFQDSKNFQERVDHTSEMVNSWMEDLPLSRSVFPIIKHRDRSNETRFFTNDQYYCMRMIGTMLQRDYAYLQFLYTVSYENQYVNKESRALLIEKFSTLLGKYKEQTCSDILRGFIDCSLPDKEKES